MANEGIEFLNQLQEEFKLAQGEKLANYVLVDIANRIFMASNCNLEPLNIVEVAKQIGFTYFEHDFISQSTRAIIGIDKKYKEYNEKGMIIKVKESESAEDKLFMATYLLSNMILNSKSRTMYYALINKDSTFNEDTLRFVRVLLMEEKAFSSAFKQEQEKAKNDQQLAINLAKRFGVSEELVRDRISELKLN